MAAVPISWLYGRVALWSRERRARAARRLSVPVISVGNITCGGTGKTPAVEMVARHLLCRGRRPALLSRGYGGGSRKAAWIPGEGIRGAGNDELRLLARNLPEVAHFQARDRYLAGLEAVAAGADTIVLDDGFQHARLARDLDLVLIDATCPFGGGHPLPAGLLREPLEALSWADALAVTRCDQVSEETLSTLFAYLSNRFPGVPRFGMAAVPVCWERHGAGGCEAPEAFRGRRFLAFCGIGNPASFQCQLERVGIEVAELLCFRDHHRYTQADEERIRARAAELGTEGVAMTQKDAVKLRGLEEAWVLRIEQRVVLGSAVYEEALNRALVAPSTP